MQGIPFTLFCDDQIKQIENRFHQHLSQWLTQHWGPTEIDFAVLTPSHEVLQQTRTTWQPDYMQTQNDETTHCVLIQQKNVSLKISFMDWDWLVNLGHHTGNVSKEELLCLVESLGNNLINEMFPNKIDADSLQSPWTRGAGNLFCKLEIKGICFEFLFNGNLLKSASPGDRAAVANTARDRKPLKRRDTSLNNAQVGLRASLGSAEISIGELSAITQGDIIKFDKKYTDKIELLNQSGEIVCQGDLGTRDEFRAVLVSDSKS